jgi:hypothetical protein
MKESYLRHVPKPATVTLILFSFRFCDQCLMLQHVVQQQNEHLKKVEIGMCKMWPRQQYQENTNISNTSGRYTAEPSLMYTFGFWELPVPCVTVAQLSSKPLRPPHWVTTRSSIHPSPLSPPTARLILRAAFSFHRHLPWMWQLQCLPKCRNAFKTWCC